MTSARRRGWRVVQRRPPGELPARAAGRAGSRRDRGCRQELGGPGEERQRAGGRETIPLPYSKNSQRVSSGAPLEGKASRLSGDLHMERKAR